VQVIEDHFVAHKVGIQFHQDLTEQSIPNGYSFCGLSRRTILSIGCVNDMIPEKSVENSELKTVSNPSVISI
jgi:hypothetical protein